jgi:hypothetical protein
LDASNGSSHGEEDVFHNPPDTEMDTAVPLRESLSSPPHRNKGVIVGDSRMSSLAQNLATSGDPMMSSHVSFPVHEDDQLNEAPHALLRTGSRLLGGMFGDFVNVKREREETVPVAGSRHAPRPRFLRHHDHDEDGDSNHVSDEDPSPRVLVVRERGVLDPAAVARRCLGEGCDVMDYESLDLPLVGDLDLLESVLTTASASCRQGDDDNSSGQLS